MKTIKIITIVTLGFMLFPFIGTAQSKQSKSDTVKNRIEVLDFHSTRRCITCNAIEANTKYTLNAFFTKELKSGKIIFQSVNVDEEKNYAKAKKFEATGTSLFLNVIVKGKETIINLTNFAFSKGRNKKKFVPAFKLKIEEQLKKL